MFTKKKRQPGQGGKRRVSRNGIPVFEKGENLARIFHALENVQDSPESQAPPWARDPGATGGAPAEVPRNRHGLPVLDREGNLKKLFETAETDDDGTGFTELVDQSLKGRDMDALLREKRERSLPGPVPLKKRLRRYPGPEIQLDLHGFTADRAGARTESFVRTSWRDGIFTLRIIVGKGLHSEFGAVLPDVVEDVLRDLKQQNVILWYDWDRKKKSTSGAVIVYLNQFND